MKRWTGFLIFVLLLCLASSALAIDLTWNQLCTKKTSTSTTLYVRESEDSDELVARGTLAAGTYIKTLGSGPNGTTYIAYSTNNNDPWYGYIDSGAVTGATIKVTLDDGSSMSVPEALQNSLQAFMYYLELHGASSSSGTYRDSNGNEHKFGSESAHKGKNEGGGDDEAWAAGMGKAAAANGTYTPTFYTDDDGSKVEVPVVYMGLARSMIRLNGEKVLVDTVRLSWETEAPEEKVLAVVTSKNYARLRAKTSKKSLIMDKCYAGAVMRVLKTGKTWTFVDYNGLRGYVLTSQVEFYRNEAREYLTGMVATKSGKTKGSSTVHVRNSPTGKQREEYRVGTPITIYEDDGKWCRIEVNGHLCYIMRQFVVYEDGVQASAPDGGA